MSGMTSERLAEVRANLPDPSADLSRRERDSHALIAHVDHLTAENARLREGIEALAEDLHVLAHTTRCTGAMCDGCQAGRIEYRARALLNAAPQESP